MKKITNHTTKKKADHFEFVKPLLDALYNEMKEFSKRKQDVSLNALKVRKINKILVSCQELLQGEASADFLELLDEETLPTNSDAVLILSEFGAAMTQFKDKYYGYNGRDHVWFAI